MPAEPHLAQLQSSTYQWVLTGLPGSTLLALGVLREGPTFTALSVFLNSSFIPAVRRIFAVRFGDERLAEGHNFTASAENQVRSGLPAGGSGIRTAGPSVKQDGDFRDHLIDHQRLLLHRE